MSSSPATHEVRCINRPGFILLPKEPTAQKVTFKHNGKDYVMFFGQKEILTWKKIHEAGKLFFDDYPFKGQDIVKDAKVTYEYD